MFGIRMAIVQLEIAEMDRKMVEARRKSMPPEQFAMFMKLRKKEQKRQRKFNEKMRVAREGRSLNFWGNR
jgi:hypothetical protein